MSAVTGFSGLHTEGSVVFAPARGRTVAAVLLFSLFATVMATPPGAMAAVSLAGTPWSSL